MDDSYKTILEPAEGFVSEKKSKFISHILPITSVEEVKPLIDDYRKRYYDARHVCWAYMLGSDRDTFRSNDDGEPSGTAGRPILGQINSAELTDVLVLVVRYFGGTLLGTSGLIKAYKEATADAIANAEIVEKLVEQSMDIFFDYALLNEVMRVLKQIEEASWTQNFTDTCHMVVRIRKSRFDELRQRFEQIHGVDVNCSESLD